MTVNMISGSCDFHSVASAGGIALIHGGVGPQDPKGDAAKGTVSSLQHILASLAKASAHQFSDFLTNTKSPRTIAERMALLAAKELESDWRFNAGFGAALQADGNARVSASFMESSRQKFSSVINLTEVLHPSEIAFYLQSERFCMLDSLGGSRLARQLNIPTTNLITQNRFERWVKAKQEWLTSQNEAPLGRGTIGCVALDENGHLAAVTSTGGVGNETAGRVGDTPTVAGNFCSQKVAVSCTGYGEQIVNEAFATKVTIRVEDGMPLPEAFHKCLTEAYNKDYGLAAICLSFDKEKGLVHWAAGETEPNLVWGAKLPDTVKTFVDYL